MIGRRALLVATLALTACLGDFHLSARDLQIGPNPAVPGDTVVASFVISLVPVERHMVVVIIDNTEHLSVTSTEPPPPLYVITLGDAEDLIAAYGPGEHSVHIEVRAIERGETARTQAVGLELQQAPPP